MNLTRARRFLALARMAKGRTGWAWRDGAAVHLESEFKVWMGEDGYFRCLADTTSYIQPDNALKGVEKAWEWIQQQKTLQVN